MSRTLQIAAVQPELRWGYPMPNMLHLRKVVEELPAAIQCVVLPEVWAGIPADDADLQSHAERGRQFLQTMARACGVHVIGGSLLRRHDDGELRNISIAVNPDGEVVGEYAKRVLFGNEQDTLRAGDGPLIIEVEGTRVAVLICADLWRQELVVELAGRADLVCVAAKTALASDTQVLYARTLWQALTLTRAMECGLPIVVSDWATGRHGLTDVDVSLGSVHAPGMKYDPGLLRRSPRERAGPLEPTATAQTSAEPALGGAVHYTAGSATICDPGRRPDMERLQRSLARGEPGVLIETIDLDAAERYREYRRTVGLLSE